MGFSREPVLYGAHSRSEHVIIVLADALALSNARPSAGIMLTTNLKILMARSKTAVSPLLTHWRYCSLALCHRSIFSQISRAMKISYFMSLTWWLSFKMPNEISRYLSELPNLNSLITGTWDAGVILEKLIWFSSTFHWPMICVIWIFAAKLN